MNFKKIVIFVVAVISAFVAAGFLIYPHAGMKIASRHIASAGGGCPYQIGLTSTVEIMCIENMGDCEPLTSLCGLLDPVRCNAYSDVEGKPAGGMGEGALFLKEAIIEAGLPPEGPLIACGAGPTLMDGGVLASVGGCYGCTARASWKDKALGIYDYIIAGFRSD